MLLYNEINVTHQQCKTSSSHSISIQSPSQFSFHNHNPVSEWKEKKCTTTVFHLNIRCHIKCDLKLCVLSAEVNGRKTRPKSLAPHTQSQAGEDDYKPIHPSPTLDETDTSDSCCWRCFCLVIELKYFVICRQYVLIIERDWMAFGLKLKLPNHKWTSMMIVKRLFIKFSAILMKNQWWNLIWASQMPPPPPPSPVQTHHMSFTHH